jgi:hypothetical protein
MLPSGVINHGWKIPHSLRWLFQINNHLCVYIIYIYMCVCEPFIFIYIYKIRYFHKPFDLTCDFPATTWAPSRDPQRRMGNLGKSQPVPELVRSPRSSGSRRPLSKNNGMLQSREILMASFVEKIWSTLRFFGVTGCYRTYFLRYSSCSAWSPPILYSQSSQMSLWVVS